jgi:hypothetical protein
MMKKLVAAVVLVGILSVAGSAMADEGRRNHRPQPRGGRQHVERRDESPEFGIWLAFPQMMLRLDGRHQEREKREWEHHRHDRHRPPHFRH